jgi:hypothetical protein
MPVDNGTESCVGHLLGTKSSLVPPIDRLNRYPVDLVDSDKLRTILALLFTEQEAFVASRFPLHDHVTDNVRGKPSFICNWRSSGCLGRRRSGPYDHWRSCPSNAMKGVTPS